MIRTSIEDAQSHPADQVVRSYKRLSKLEHVFRNMKTTQLLVRPIYHYNGQRVRAHIFLCMLAAHILWHLEQRLADLLFHDPDRDELNRTGDPVEPKPRSQEGVRKDTEQTSDDDDYPPHSLRTLMTEMGTLQRHTMRVADVQGAPTWDQLSVPSQHQRRVFEAAGVRLV